jgi:hypothetical protein
MRAHLTGRVLALGVLVGSVAVLLFGAVPAQAAVVRLSHAEQQLLPTSGTTNTIVGVLALTGLVLGMGWLISSITSERRLATAEQAAAAPVPLRSVQTDEQSKEPRKAA